MLSFCTHCRSLLASGSADNTVKLWDLSELKCILTLPHPDKVTNHMHTQDSLLGGKASLCFLSRFRVYSGTGMSLSYWQPGVMMGTLSKRVAGVFVSEMNNHFVTACV